MSVFHLLALLYLTVSFIIGAERKCTMPKGTPLNLSVERVVELWQIHGSLSAIAAECGCTNDDVSARLCRAGIKQRDRRLLTDEEKQRISAGYAAGQSMKEIAGIIGVDMHKVHRHLQREGIARRDNATAKRTYYAYHVHPRLGCKWIGQQPAPRFRSLREDAFDNAETDPEAAYWVGMMMADGYVASKRHRVSLGLAIKDHSHVVQFQQFLQAETPVHVTTRKPRSGAYAGSTAIATLMVTSKRLVTALGQYGVTPRKSKTAKVLRLHDNPHFWRGCIDGDGWIYLIKSRYPLIGFTGSKKMVEQFVDFIENITGVRPRIEPNKTVWKTTISCTKAVQVIKAIYGHPGPRLMRKAIRATKAMEWARTMPDRREFTLEKLLSIKNDFGTWDNAAAHFGTSANTLAQLLSERRKRGY
jgi:Helix-turn-helix domain